MGWVPQICLVAVVEILSNCSTTSPAPSLHCHIGSEYDTKKQKVGGGGWRWNSHARFRSLRTLGKAGSYYHSKFAMRRVEEIRCVLPLKCIFQPLCDGKFHQVLEAAMIRGTGYECCAIKSRHLSNKMKHSQTPAKWKINLSSFQLCHS